MIKEYLNNLFHSKKEENIKANTSFRKSYNEFPKYDNEKRILKYKYYDIFVKGVSHRNFDISKIELNHPIYFECEPDNPYDENAIKILYDDIFIGYIPKNNLQEMMKTYSNGTTHQIYGFISSVNEELKEIQIGLGFYKKER